MRTKLLLVLAVTLFAIALPVIALAQVSPTPPGTTEASDVLAVLNGLFGDTPLPWLPTAKILAVITVATQAIKKLMRLAPILDRYTHGWASVGLNTVATTLAVLLPALTAGQVTGETLIQFGLAIVASGGLYELCWRLFHKLPPPVMPADPQPTA